MLSILLKRTSQVLGDAIHKIQGNQLCNEGKSLYERQKYKEAIAPLKEVAKRGNVFAIIVLGQMRMQGLGGETNWQDAVRLFQLAIDCKNEEVQRSTIAMLHGDIGLMLGIGGYGVKRNLEKAKIHVQKAVELGNTEFEPALKKIIGKKDVFGKKEVGMPDLPWGK